MKKLFIDANALVADHFSGIGHYLQGIVVELDSKLSQDSYADLEVYLIVPFKRVDRLKKYHFKNIKIRTIPLPMSIFRRIIVKGLLPPMDLIYGKGVYFFPDYVTWPLARSKAITTIHDLSFEEVPEFVDDTNAQFLRKTVQYSVNHAYKIATVTQTMKEQIQKFYNIPASSVIVTTNAAEMTHFYKRSSQEVKKVKRKYGISGDYILSVGNIEPRKNQLALIEALGKLPKYLTDKYSLVFVGAGGWKSEATEKAIHDALEKDLKVVVVQGRVTDEDLPAIYSGASIMAYPSFYEGFGMPIIEAMACQTPVIVSNKSVMPEVSGGAGVEIDPSDTSSIAKAIEEVDKWSEKQRSLAIDEGLHRARSYTWADSVDKLLNVVYEEGGSTNG